MLLTLADEVREREQRASWSNTEELLARTLEGISTLRRDLYMMKGVPERKLPAQVMVPRPGEPAPNPNADKKVVRPGQLAKMLGKG